MNFNRISAVVDEIWSTACPKQQSSLWCAQGNREWNYAKKNVNLQGVQKCPGHVWNKLIVDVNNRGDSKSGNNSLGWSEKSPIGYFPTQYHSWGNLGMKTEVFPGVPDEFGGGPTTLHPDPEPRLQPLRGAVRRERTQETPCSCARKNYSVAAATTLTCPTFLWDCAISHTE